MEIPVWNLTANVVEEQGPNQPVLHRLMMDTARKVLHPSPFANEQIHSLQEAAFKVLDDFKTEKEAQYPNYTSILGEVLTSTEMGVGVEEATALYEQMYPKGFYRTYINKDEIDGLSRCAIVLILMRKVSNNAGPTLSSVLKNLEEKNQSQVPTDRKRR